MENGEDEMSKSDTSSTLRRMLELLLHLPRNGAYASSRDLLEKLLSESHEVEKRTVERDLKLLAEVFAPNIECNDKSRPYGWRWKDGRALEGVGLSVTEALSLQVIEDTLKPLLPASVLKTLQPRFKLARKTLAELAPKNRQAAWVEKVRNVQPSMPLAPPKVDEEVLAVVHECLLHDESLTGEYQSAGTGYSPASVMGDVSWGCDAHHRAC
ncbi:hypothetical protein GCM10027046_13330 [Uliginosibacterium flavum]|uniref:WYL domain-containing protein n=1 Tax=Uliginosibacterium flavum TaxID=1396831 RepID=A0ABV2TQ07_9RHOO